MAKPWIGHSLRRTALSVMFKKPILLALLLCFLAGCEKRADRPASMTGTSAAATAIPSAARDLGRPNSKQPCPTCPPLPTPTATPAIGDRSHPIPFGETFQLVAEEGPVFTLTLTESLRGEEAWQRVLDANQFNEPPREGVEYLLILAQVAYPRGLSGQMLPLDSWDFRIVTRNQVLEPPTIVAPEPAFKFRFFPGASGEGWMVWPVFAGDEAPLLVYGLKYDGSGGTYFVAAPLQ